VSSRSAAGRLEADPRADESPAVLRLRNVSVRIAGRTILGPLDWTVRPGERWVVLGPNGAGKTTLLQVISTYLWPTTGAVEVLGRTLGRVDARELRRAIGYAGAGLERAIPDRLTSHDIVVTARAAALGPWWSTFTVADHNLADGLLARLGVGGLRDRTFGTLSTGERRRVQVARALLPDPDLLLLDEPSASLDLGARERLVRDLAGLASEPRPAAIVLANHHVEEIPAGFGHALVLREGLIVAAGPIRRAVTSATLSAAFGLPIRVARRGSRLVATLDGAGPGSGDGAGPGSGPSLDDGNG
jgi:iron complex transport system ATP-binding protein